MVNSQGQLLLIGLAALVFFGVLWVIKLLWNVREPAGAIISSYNQSEQGSAVIVKVMRDYASSPDGMQFLHAKIETRVREIVKDHNTAEDAHHKLLKGYATVQELNGAVNSVRDLMNAKTETILAEQKRLSQQIDHLTGLVKSETSELEARFDDLREIVIAHSKERQP